MDDTTTIRIFEKLDVISVDVGVITAAMPNLATKDHVDLKIAEHAALPSRPPKANGGRMTAVILGVIGALTATVIALTQLL